MEIRLSPPHLSYRFHDGGRGAGVGLKEKGEVGFVVQKLDKIYNSKIHFKVNDFIKSPILLITFG